MHGLAISCTKGKNGDIVVIFLRMSRNLFTINFEQQLQNQGYCCWE